mgnify:CR=1 FL=1
MRCTHGYGKRKISSRDFDDPLMDCAGGLVANLVCNLLFSQAVHIQPSIIEGMRTAELFQCFQTFSKKSRNGWDKIDLRQLYLKAVNKSIAFRGGKK